MLAVNVLAFLMFGFDKTCAKAGMKRISEATLLEVALLGGAPGAKLGQRLFRHKTRKEPFRTRLNRIVLLQGTAVLVFAGLIISGPL